MKFCLKFWITVVTLAWFGLVSTGTGLAAEKALKVLVLPFKMNAAQDLTYIQDGILDMISSRLAWDDRVIVLERSVARKAFEQVQGNIDDRTALELGRKSGADYVLYGSLTMIGQSVSLDVRIINQLEKKPDLTIHTQSGTIDDFIPKINAFAQSINRKIFKRTVEPKYAESKKQKAPQPSRRHPESLLVRPEERGLFRTAETSRGEGGFWRSPFLSVAITGMDIGDIDGDKKNEIAYTSLNKVFVGRYEQGRFRRIAVFTGYKNDHFFTMDVADINGNGKAEIFVNNRVNGTAESYVLEYANGKLKPILKNSPWYYRVLNMPYGRILAGQEGGTNTLFYGPVYRMKARNKTYVPDVPLGLPRRKVNILNFGLVRFAGQENENIVTINEDENLQILNRSGKSLWDSQEQFGGSIIYLKLDFQNDIVDINSEKKYYYVPPRILIADSNGDGQNEALVARAKLPVLASIMTSLRPLTKGSVYSLTFDNMALKENWHTPALGGYPVDYQIKDYNNDGSPDLVIAVILKAGETLFTESRSVIEAFSLKGLKQEAKTEK